MEKLNGLVNVAAHAAGGRVTSKSAIPRSTYTDECGDQKRPGGCQEKWCGEIGCNVLDGIYGGDASHRWLPSKDYSGGWGIRQIEVRFKSAHVPEYLSHMTSSEGGVRVRIQLVYSNGGKSKPIEPILDTTKTAWSPLPFRLIKVPPQLKKRKAMGAIFTFRVSNRGLPILDLGNPAVDSVDIWAKVEKPLVHFMNPIVPLRYDKAGKVISRWHDFTCKVEERLTSHGGTSGTYRTEHYYKIDNATDDFKKAKGTKQCVMVQTVGGALGYKQEVTPICAIGKAFKGCSGNQCWRCVSKEGVRDQASQKHPKSRQQGGTFAVDVAVARGMCSKSKKTCLPMWKQEMLKGYCKMVKKTACKYCGVTSQKRRPKGRWHIGRPEYLDKTIHCGGAPNRLGESDDNAGDWQVTVTGPAKLVKKAQRTLCHTWAARGHCRKSGFVARHCKLECKAGRKARRGGRGVKDGKKVKKKSKKINLVRCAVKKMCQCLYKDGNNKWKPCWETLPQMTRKCQDLCSMF